MATKANALMTAAWCAALVIVLGARAAQGFGNTPVNAYERFFTVRDDTNYRVNGKPAGGWMVTPVHAIPLKDGKVMIAAWARRDQFSCTQGVKYGTTFILDPNDIIDKGFLPRGNINIVPMNGAPDIDNGNTLDVITFSGHATLPDSRKFFVGGSRLQGSNWGEGIGYARVYDHNTRTFARVKHDQPFGTSWYGTAATLPDQRILVTPGFVHCCDGRQSSAMATFDFERFANNELTNPWELLLSNAESREDAQVTSADYPRLLVLQEPVEVAGIPRQVATIGTPGIVSFLNTDRFRAHGERFVTRAGAQRPGQCGSRTTAAVLATGQIMVHSGCVGSTMLDLYDPKTNTWESHDSGIVRLYASGVLLPNGNVLLINGENAGINQNTGVGRGGDPRQPQIFDPFAKTFSVLPEEPADGTDSANGQAHFRAYHNIASLLMDGRILTGGGVHSEGGITCEHPNLRVMNPPYLLTRAIRPGLNRIANLLPDQDATLRLEDAGSFLDVEFSAGSAPLLASSGKPGTRSGAVLMAHGAITHSYDQAQRYVPLRYEVQGSNLRVFAPPAPLGIPGDYTLFLVDVDGVPSKGHFVRLLPAKGEWLRTVVFVRRATTQNERVVLRGGHSASLASRYGGSTIETIIHHNLLGDTGPSRRQDTSLDWDSDSTMSWTSSPGSSAYHDDNKVFYSRYGFGVDPENTMGPHWHKFEVFMKPSPAADPTHQDWFEFQAGFVNQDGQYTWETPRTHLTTEGGPQPPALSSHHWAKKGHMTVVVFNENAAEIHPLNELGLPEAWLPFAPPTAAPTRGPTQSPSSSPTRGPTAEPTSSPTMAPTLSPSRTPTLAPSMSPSTSSPTASPSTKPPTNEANASTLSSPEPPPPTTMSPLEIGGVGLGALFVLFGVFATVGAAFATRRKRAFDVEAGPDAQPQRLGSFVTSPSRSAPTSMASFNPRLDAPTIAGTRFGSDSLRAPSSSIVENLTGRLQSLRSGSSSGPGQHRGPFRFS